jgi:hypothetical protein
MKDVKVHKLGGVRSSSCLHLRDELMTDLCASSGLHYCRLSRY